MDYETVFGERKERAERRWQTISPTYHYEKRLGQTVIVCNCCEFASFNPRDIEEKYCGFCKRFHKGDTMSNLIDLGQYQGRHIFYTGGRTIAELIQDGAIIAVPDKEEGVIFKRPVNCTEVELAAKLTLEEVQRINNT